MSHFTVMIIGENPEDQLEPYSEHNDVPEYKVGVVDEKEKERFISYYERIYPESIGMTLDEMYAKYGEDWNGNEWRKNSETGEYEEFSVYNPNSKWDWYELGGRWSGMIKLKDGAKSGVVGNPGVFGNETGIDQANFGDISNFDELGTFAVLKHGVWYERGEMGWFGCVSNEKGVEEWEEIQQDLFADISADTLISIYDCHI